MAMFTPNQRDSASTSSSGGAETFIGPSVKLEGNFTGEGDVVVEGMLVGNLTTKGDVRVGSGAVIEAEIRARNASIAGKVKGNLTVTGSLRLSSTALIMGDIKTLSLAVEEGAQINGKLIMSKEKLSREIPAPMTEKIKVSGEDQG